MSGPGEVGRLSPDGLWKWDGDRWVPTGAAQVTTSTGASGPRRPWASLIGGTVSIASTAVLLAACFFPYGYFSDGNGGTSSSSIFNGGYPGAGWQIPEPLFVVVAALAMAIVVMAVRGTVRAVASGALVALGLQTLMMWITYTGTAISGGRIGPGSWIGLTGSMVLLVGGILALIGLFIERPE
ncbi:MAG: hypothetical protein E6J20_03190 [Chloroflexi bacterium]|nr:MAG: hypothetical protein E6J20_03190 [Chloroflexota bacterium]